MALRIVADSAADLPEPLRGAAKMVEGKPVVETLPDGWALEDVAGLKRTLSEERTSRKALEKAVAQFEGIDDAAAAREALTQMRAGALKSSKELDEFRKQLEAKVGADLAKKDQAVSALTKQLTEQLVDGAALKAIAEAGGNPKLLMPILRSAVKAEMGTDGTFAVTLHDEQGKQLVSTAAGATGPMGIAEFVSQLRTQPEFKGAFAGSGTGGSGASSATGGSGRAASQAGPLSSTDLFARANATG